MFAFISCDPYYIINKNKNNTMETLVDMPDFYTMKLPATTIGVCTHILK